MANSDDDVLIQERKRLRRAGYLQYGGMLFILLMACWAYLPTLEAWREAAFPFDFYVMGACILAMFLGVAFVGTPSAAAESQRLIPRQIDGYLTQARRQWLLFLVLLLGPVAGASRLIASIDEGVRVHRLPADYAVTHGGSSQMLLALMFIGVAVSFALPLTFRSAYNQVLQDELVRELRAKAIRIGYIGAVAALAAVFVLLSVSAIDPRQLLLWLGYAVVALPIVSYALLEARAGRGD